MAAWLLGCVFLSAWQWPAANSFRLQPHQSLQPSNCRSKSKLIRFWPETGNAHQSIQVAFNACPTCHHCSSLRPDVQCSNPGLRENDGAETNVSGNILSASHSAAPYVVHPAQVALE